MTSRYCLTQICRSPIRARLNGSASAEVDKVDTTYRRFTLPAKAEAPQARSEIADERMIVERKAIPLLYRQNRNEMSRARLRMHVKKSSASCLSPSPLSPHPRAKWPQSNRPLRQDHSLIVKACVVCVKFILHIAFKLVQIHQLEGRCAIE